MMLTPWSLLGGAKSRRLTQVVIKTPPLLFRLGPRSPIVCADRNHPVKIAHYATLSSLVLLLVAAGQALALYQGWQQLARTNQALHQHEALQQQVTVTLQNSLRDYLNTGDPQQLTAAEKIRQQVLTSLASSNDAVTTPLREQLEQMAQRIAHDYQAAGKLSGNSQLLLQNAEYELGNQAMALIRYGEQGASTEQSAAAQQYRKGASEILAGLPRLAHLRQSYMEQGNEKLLEGIRFELEALQKQAQAKHCKPCRCSACMKRRLPMSSPWGSRYARKWEINRAANYARCWAAIRRSWPTAARRYNSNRLAARPCSKTS